MGREDKREWRRGRILLAPHREGAMNDSLVISYLGLRKAIGVAGIALPFVLALGRLATDGFGIERSISAYYHTGMRDVFVGGVCAVAFFLMSYRGYERKDDLAGHFACACALGVALFPVAPAGSATLAGRLHFVFATFLFLTLAYFALALFRRTDPRLGPPTPRKLQRNAVYTACGFTVLACIVLIALFELLPEGAAVHRVAPVFWLESAALLAFGVCWFTKGEAILKDQDTSPRAPGAAIAAMKP
jgi:hypothetical protein